MGAKTAGGLELALIGLFLGLFAACGAGDDTDDTLPTTITEAAGGETTVPSCGDERHAVVFDVSGTLADDAGAIDDWISGDSPAPDPRPGSVALTKAYLALGYEILYASTSPTDQVVDGQPVLDALTDWLTTNEFAVGTGTRVFGVDPARQRAPAVALADELVRTHSEGVVVDYGYAGSADNVLAFQTGGVAPAHTFSVNDDSGANGSTAIPADDLVSHRAMVDGLPRVCE